MNTREKIRSFDQLGALALQEEWVVVVGLFNPVTAEHADRLAKYPKPGQRLLVVVLDGPNTLLDAEARAILVASLRIVQAVVTCGEEEWREFTRKAPIELIDELEGDRLRTAKFVQFVLERQAGAPVEALAER